MRNITKEREGLGKLDESTHVSRLKRPGPHLPDGIRSTRGGSGNTRSCHGLHRKLSMKFPFAIYYKAEGSVIDVVAVLDCRGDPDAVAERLGRANR